MFAKPGAPRREVLTVQVKNTMLHLNGQNLKLAAKNGRNSKTPGIHFSATHGKETVGQLTASSPTQEGTAQHLPLLKSPRPDMEREARERPARRPLKLAPLELPEEVKEAQKQKLKVIQQEAKPAACKLGVKVKEPCTRKAKSCVKQRLVKAAALPPASAEQKKSSRPRLTRSEPIEQNGDKHLEDVMCRGIPAPLRSKPTPPLLSRRIESQAACGGDAARQKTGALQQETGRRRVRLRRAQCLEEDQCNSNTSTGGLSADEGKLAQGVQSKGHGVLRGQPHAGKGIKEPPAASQEYGGVRKSHHKDCRQQSARCTLNQQAAEHGRSEHALDGIKPSASDWRLKRKKPLITKHNNAIHLEHLQL